MSDDINVDESEETTTAKPRWYARFTAADYLSIEDADDYRVLVGDDVPHMLEVNLLKRHGTLATTLPAFAWSSKKTATMAEEREWQLSIIGNRMRGLGFRKTDVIYKEGRYYYRDSFLSAVKSRLKVPLVAEALIRFMHRAEESDEPLISSNPYPSERQYIPPEDRETASGRRHRGPTWTPEEDYVVQKWFSRHINGEHAGRHAPLTEAQWQHVLLELNGRRAKNEVRSRIRQLNHQLKVSLIVDGLISHEGVRTYMRKALGESEPLPPRNRPRIKGRSYWAG